MVESIPYLNRFWLLETITHYFLSLFHSHFTLVQLFRFQTYLLSPTEVTLRYPRHYIATEVTLRPPRKVKYIIY